MKVFQRSQVNPTIYSSAPLALNIFSLDSHIPHQPHFMITPPTISTLEQFETPFGKGAAITLLFPPPP